MTDRLVTTSFAADLSGCAALAELANDEVMALFTDTLRHAGATIRESVSHDFPGTGVTCVLILSESHAVLHSWPEHGAISIDIFSCTSRLQSVKAINALGRTFGACRVSIQEVARSERHASDDDAGG